MQITQTTSSIATTAEQKLARLKSGAIFIQDTEERIKRAFELAASQKDNVDFIIWLCKQTCILSKNYKTLISKYSEGFRSKLYVFPLESISASDTNFLKLNDLARNKKCFCIIDDSSIIKNAQSGCSQRLFQLGPKFSYRLILSSTPITLGLIDLYSQLQFMSPQLLKMSYIQFSNIYLTPITNRFDNQKMWSTKHQENMLIQKISPYILDADLDFDYPINRYNLYANLTTKEKQSYDEEKERLPEGRDYVHFMEIFHKFQHIYTISQNKVKLLCEILSKIRLKKEKVIIYVKYLDEIRFFQESGLFDSQKYVILNGQCNKKRAFSDFSTAIDTMFCSYGVDNLGINVPSYNNVIFFSQTFSYQFKLQAIKQALRGNTNQENKNKRINVYDLWVNTGLEEMVQQNLLMKQKVIKRVCQKISKEEALRL